MALHFKVKNNYKILNMCRVFSCHVSSHVTSSRWLVTERYVGCHDVMSRRVIHLSSDQVRSSHVMSGQDESCQVIHVRAGQIISH